VIIDLKSILYSFYFFTGPFVVFANAFTGVFAGIFAGIFAGLFADVYTVFL
jgi:hypothetical protein